MNTPSRAWADVADKLMNETGLVDLPFNLMTALGSATPEQLSALTALLSCAPRTPGVKDQVTVARVFCLGSTRLTIEANGHICLELTPSSALDLSTEEVMGLLDLARLLEDGRVESALWAALEKRSTK